MPTSPYVKQLEYSPDHLGLNAKAIDSAANSNWFDTRSFNQLTLQVDYVYDAGTTALTWYYEFTNDISGTPTARRVQSGSISAGVNTLTDYQESRAVAGADLHFGANLPINYWFMRLASITVGGTPTTSDTVTFRAFLGVL